MSTRFTGPPPGQHESLDRMADAGNYNDWLFERSRPYLGGRILDFGSGIGTFAAEASPFGDVVAVEPDPLFAAELRKRFDGSEKVTVVEADAGWLEGLDVKGAFDTVLCFNVLEHIADHERVLRAFRACLKPEGHALLLVPAHPALYGAIDRNVGHERRYTRGGLRRALQRAELTPVELRYVNPLGAVGWLVASRILRHEQVPAGPLRAYDVLVPVLRSLDRLPWPFGLSVWAVARS